MVFLASTWGSCRAYHPGFIFPCSSGERPCRVTFKASDTNCSMDFTGNDLWIMFPCPPLVLTVDTVHVSMTLMTGSRKCLVSCMTQEVRDWTLTCFTSVTILSAISSRDASGMTPDIYTCSILVKGLAEEFGNSP